MHSVKHVSTVICEGELFYVMVNMVNGMCHNVMRADTGRMSKSMVMYVCNMRLLQYGYKLCVL